MGPAITPAFLHACTPCCSLQQSCSLGKSTLSECHGVPNWSEEENHPAKGGRNAPGNAPGEKWENRKNGGKWGKMGENGGNRLKQGARNKEEHMQQHHVGVYNLRSTSWCKMNYCRLSL